MLAFSDESKKMQIKFSWGSLPPDHPTFVLYLSAYGLGPCSYIRSHTRKLLRMRTTLTTPFLFDPYKILSTPLKSLKVCGETVLG